MATPPSVLHGLGVSPGLAVGPVARMVRLTPTTAAVADARGGRVGDAGTELAAVGAALEAVAADLDARADRAGGAAADVLRAQSMMARDPALTELIGSKITGGHSGAAAISEALAEFRALLTGAGGYLAERAADLDDIRDRAVARLLGLAVPGVPEPGHPFVLVARDLAPADTATLDPAEVLGIITEEGGPTSHTAILAKSLGIPAVVACVDAASLQDGTPVLVDGATGSVTVRPDGTVLADAQRRRERRATMLAGSAGTGRTADGHPVKLLVNLGAPRDLAPAAAADSEGVGLFRTEFLFLDREGTPDLDEQRAAYREVFDHFPGRTVVVRTLDAGADKPLPFLGLDPEPNPALGIRGLRTARRRPDVLAGQLQAIAEAAEASGADVWVMAPMVATPEEAAWFAEQARGHQLPTVGVMIEIPAAALRARQVLEQVDFVSLGTNDLAQYTLAVDRMAGGLSELLDFWQPALLDLVAVTASAGRTLDKPVGVCGEMAGDPLLALALTGMGVTSLSMAPGSLPAVRAALRAHTLAECQRLAEIAVRESTPLAARHAVLAASHGDPTG